MTPEEHKERHRQLHRSLDELVADFIMHNNKLLSETTVMELVQWSYQQTIEPTVENNGEVKVNADTRTNKATVQ